MSANGDDDLLTLLVGGGHLSPSLKAIVAGYAQRWAISPFHALLETSVMDEADLADALGATLAIDRMYHLLGQPVDEEALKIIGFRRAREWECLALTSDGGLDLVLADPTQKDRIGVLRRELNCELTLAVAERSDIVGAIDELFPLPAQLPSLFGACSRP
jgi:hypothetical protein